MVRAVAVAAALAAALAAPALAQRDWREAFAAGIESADSWERRAAVEAVDPDDQRGVKVLLTLLADDAPGRVGWWVRDAVIDRLAGVGDGRADRLLAKGLRARQDRVRAGVVRALGRRARSEDLRIVLKVAEDDDEAPRVRRAVVEALAAYGAFEGEAVAALLELWAGEDGPATRLGVRIRLALQGLPGPEVDYGLDREAWAAWWATVAGDWPEGAEPAEEEAERPDDPMRTRVRGVGLRYTESGEGERTALVIPDYLFEPGVYKPWFRALEDELRVIYMELPPVSAFPADELEEFADGVPYYPIDLLVDAFDDLRAEKGVARFVLIAHGFNSLIAMRYLTRHPARVSHAILINPISGGQAWGRVIDGIQREGQATEDPEMSHLARNMLIYPDGSHDYETSSEEEERALRRKAVGLYFADGADPAVADVLWPYEEEDTEESVTPDFELSRQAKTNVPILIQAGERNLWTVPDDPRKFTDHYPQATVEAYPESAMCPFVEDAAAWAGDIAEFLRRHPR